MKAIYHSSTHSIEELPEIKEPDNSTGWSEVSNGMRYKDEYHRLLDKEVEERYRKHIASLKSYPVSGEVKWKDGDILEEGKDFKLDWDLAKSLYHGKPTDIFVVPIEQNKKVKEEKEKEDEVGFVEWIFKNEYTQYQLGKFRKKKELFRYTTKELYIFYVTQNNLVECKEKDQDELWLEIAMWHNSENSYKDFVNKCKANFSISKK